MQPVKGTAPTEVAPSMYAVQLNLSPLNNPTSPHSPFLKSSAMTRMPRNSLISYWLVLPLQRIPLPVIPSHSRRLCHPLQSTQWRAAMQSEMDSLAEAGTYTLTPPPSGVTPIGCKWVFVTKRDAAGAIIKHKARLVAKGFSQRYGIDYEETYAPVCRIGSIRVLLALATHFDWEVDHMDVTSAFLNGDLEEIVYMNPTPWIRVHWPAGRPCMQAEQELVRSQTGWSYLESEDG